ncbi:hypothetical protein TNCV_3439951 [Trichonephila clavipes]|nr:hypothetical protein TNCV_3439951 [Trichonephila clavipes]
MDWPAQSPDFNPIENLKDKLDHRFKSFKNHPKSVKESCLLQTKRKKIPLSIKQKPLESMPGDLSTKVYKELEAVCLRLTVVWGETMSQAPVGSSSEEGWNRRHKSVALGGWGRERPANRFSFPLPSESMEWPQKRSVLKIVV